MASLDEKVVRRLLRSEHNLSLAEYVESGQRTMVLVQFVKKRDEIRALEVEDVAHDWEPYTRLAYIITEIIFYDVTEISTYLWALVQILRLLRDVDRI